SPAGRGVRWEAGLLKTMIYDERPKRILTILFDKHDASTIPDFIRPFPFYVLPEQYEPLYRELLGQSGAPEPALGKPSAMPKQTVRSKGASCSLAEVDRGKAPELLEIKYARMLASLWTFFRGSAPLFYARLPQASVLEDAPPAYASGDVHFSSFGVYMGDMGNALLDITYFNDAALA